MSFYASYPVTGSGSGGGVTIYPSASGFPAASTVVAGTLAMAADTGILYESNGSVWQKIGGPGVPLTIGTPANGLSLSSNELDIGLSSASTIGALSSTDWSTFNNKQPAGNYIAALTGDGTAAGPGSSALTLATVNSNVGSFSPAAVTVNAKGLVTAASNVATGNLTDAGTDGITVTGGTGAVLGSGASIAQHVADSTHNGYLSSTDWSTFNGKQAAGNYITALTGDVTASGPGSVGATIASNAVTNAKAAQMATLTIKGNNTGGTANASDLTVAQTKAMLNTAMTVQRFTTGSGTYTTPTSPAPLYIKIKIAGAGGGGSGSGSTAGTPNASPGGSSTWSVHSGSAILTAAGGASGGTNQGGLPGSGGAPTTAAGATPIVSISGGAGGGGGFSNSASTYAQAGGHGGVNAFGGGGKSGTGGGLGGDGAANTGAGGGGGAGAAVSNVSAGHGGGAGAYIEAFIGSPSASYDYAVGAGASGGTNGNSGFSGGAGGSGVIIVEEYYQ
jgi:hypothetical protein